MSERKELYFVSDVHLGLKSYDPVEREARFLSFLKGLPRERVAALYLLGDIWDFWYEYRDVVPKIGAKVVAEFISLMDSGVQVYFCPGNHDIWTFSYFESLGMKRIDQPHCFEFEGRTFCVGHGDALGGAALGYRILQAIFKSKIAQSLFSTLHPWLAFRFGLGWSSSNRKIHKKDYNFDCAKEPLYKFTLESSGQMKVDYFIFGHFHDAVDEMLPGGARFFVMNDWMRGGVSYVRFNGSSCELHF